MTALVDQVEAAGLSLGPLTADHVIASPAGLVLTALPAGPLADHGPTDLRAIRELLPRSSRPARRMSRTWLSPRLTRSA